MVRTCIVILGLLFCTVDAVAQETRFLIDRSSSMDGQKTGNVLTVLNQNRMAIATLGEPSIISWNDNPSPVRRWNPTLQELDTGIILAAHGLTNLGIALSEVAIAETSICPRYIIIVDGMPSDQDNFMRAMAGLNEFTTVAVGLLMHEQGYENTKNGFQRSRRLQIITSFSLRPKRS